MAQWLRGGGGGNQWLGNGGKKWGGFPNCSIETKVQSPKGARRWGGRGGGTKKRARKRGGKKSLNLINGKTIYRRRSNKRSEGKNPFPGRVSGKDVVIARL